jgi:hypothetical protein
MIYGSDNGDTDDEIQGNKEFHRRRKWEAATSEYEF